VVDQQLIRMEEMQLIKLYGGVVVKKQDEANYRGKEMHMMAVENLALCVLLMVI